MRLISAAHCCATLIFVVGCGLDGNWPQPLDHGGGRPCCARPYDVWEPVGQEMTEQGSFVITDGELDVGIRGSGFFALKAVEHPRLYYTRAGNLSRDSLGVVVAANSMELVPRLVIPVGAADLSVAENGDVSYVDPDGYTVLAGNIQLTQFQEPTDLIEVEDNLYVASEDAGDPISGTPGESSFGVVLHHQLEVDVQLAAQPEAG